MYKIIPSKLFQRSISRIRESGKFKEKKLYILLELLRTGKPLPPQYQDHALSGKLVHLRECHIRGDLLLLYQKKEDFLILVLVDIGSHHELFGK